MNIAMISYHTCPRASQEGKETGGMEIYVMGLSRALARMGHSVDIFTRSHEPNDPLIISEEPRLRVIHLHAGPQQKLPKKSLAKYIPEFSTRMFEFIVKEDFSYDILHAHYYMSGLVAEKLFKKEKNIGEKTAGFVITFHTLAIMKNLVARDTLERESQLRIRAEFRLMRKASAIVASSETDKEYMRYLYDTAPEKIFVVYPGIDTALFYPADKATARAAIGASPDHKIVLFVGRVEPLKGIDTLLYAMKILKSKHAHQTVCLWIVGGDTSEPESCWPKTLKDLTKLRNTLGIPEEHIHFVGHQPQSELPNYYNAADIVVAPSHYESFGMTALEAIACGIPVITTNVAGIAASIDDTHLPLITSVSNPLLLASQMDEVLQSKTLARKPLQLASWDQEAKKVLVAYECIN